MSENMLGIEGYILLGLTTYEAPSVHPLVCQVQSQARSEIACWGKGLVILFCSCFWGGGVATPHSWKGESRGGRLRRWFRRGGGNGREDCHDSFVESRGR